MGGSGGIKMIKLAKRLLLYSTLALTALALAAAPASPIFAEEDIHASINTSFSNAYVANEGQINVDNIVNQSMISVDAGWLSAYTWMNYDIEQRKPTEIDYSLKVNFNLGKRVSGSAGYEAWTYPQVKGDNVDHAGVVSLGYNGLIDSNLTIKKLLTQDYDSGYMVLFGASKSFDLPSIGPIRLSAKPLISSVYLNDFFDRDGISRIRAGLSLDAQLPKGFSLNATNHYQQSLDKEIAETTPIISIGIDKNF